MSKVKAKFKCDSMTPIDGDQTQLKMSAVVSGSEENKSFSRWTPAANLEMCISNETAAKTFFEPGLEYYLTFEVASIPVD